MGFGKFLGFVVGGCVAVVCAPAIGAIASAAGLGVAAGTLSGAAASSAGLAALGGGSVMAGGFGMAGGTAVVGLVGATAGAVTAGTAADSFIDNVIKDKVDSPVIGSMVYCDLPVGEHSGIYIGSNQIVHLDGDGDIIKSSPNTFMNRLNGANFMASSIYVSCQGDKPVGSIDAAERAKKMIGKKRNYQLFFDNCHQFTAGCLTGEFENPNNFLTFLKDEAANCLEADNWKVWDTARPSSSLEIILSPVNENDFKRAFLRKKLATVKIYKIDGSCTVSEWKLNKFSESSSVKRNLLSGRLRGWRDKGICRAEVTV